MIEIQGAHAYGLPEPSNDGREGSAAKNIGVHFLRPGHRPG